MNLRPLHDRVVVKPDEPEEVTKGGIIMPDTAKEKPMQGTVVAVGPGKWEYGLHIPMTIRLGDSVLYGKYAGTPIDIDGEELLAMKESDIFAITATAKIN